jgi:alpha-amylase
MCCLHFEQSFNWESPKKYPWYHILRDQVDEIALAGITDVWLPPPSQSVDVNGMPFQSLPYAKP